MLLYPQAKVHASIAARLSAESGLSAARPSVQTRGSLRFDQRPIDMLFTHR